jgi:hypothetical protein
VPSTREESEQTLFRKVLLMHMRQVIPRIYWHKNQYLATNSTIIKWELVKSKGAHNMKSQTTSTALSDWSALNDHLITILILQTDTHILGSGEYYRKGKLQDARWECSFFS